MGRPGRPGFVQWSGRTTDREGGEAWALVVDLSASKPRRLTVLGSGTSTGVPVIGCDCAVCRSDDPRNQRTRSQRPGPAPAGGNLLIDTSPEMRLQLVRERVGPGPRDRLHPPPRRPPLRPRRRPDVPQASSAGRCRSTAKRETEETIRRVFHYAFEERARSFPSGGVPKIDVRADRAGRPVRGPRADDPADPARPRPVPGPGVPDRRPGLLHGRQLDPRGELAAPAKGSTP